MQGIEFITKLNPDGFREYLKKTENTICGSQPILIALEMFKNVKVNVKLLKYAQSGKIVTDFNDSSVSYAAILFY